VAIRPGTDIARYDPMRTSFLTTIAGSTR